MVKRNYKESKIFLERICFERSCGKNGGSRYQISKTKRSHTVQVGTVGNKKKVLILVFMCSSLVRLGIVEVLTIIPMALIILSLCIRVLFAS
jgi:hypothetical protein